MKIDTAEESNWIHLIQDYIVDNDGVLYLVNGEYYFLHLFGWVWDLADAKEFRELLEDQNLLQITHGNNQTRLIDRLIKCLTSSAQQTVTQIQVDLLNENREDLRQHILNTYYPI